MGLYIKQNNFRQALPHYINEPLPRPSCYLYVMARYVMLQVVLFLATAVPSLAQCRQSPLTVGGLAEDFNELFPGLPDNVLLVDRGTVPVFLRSPSVSDQLALRDDITIVPLVWFSSSPAVIAARTSDVTLTPTPSFHAACRSTIVSVCSHWIKTYWPILSCQ